MFLFIKLMDLYLLVNMIIIEIINKFKGKKIKIVFQAEINMLPIQ